MATYSISAPDGNTYQIEGPAGATQEQVKAEVLRQHPNAGGVKAAPEVGNMYTQGAEDIVYDANGIPQTTSSYGSAPTGATKSAQQALTSTVSLPLNVATGAAKAPAAIAQLIGKYFGSNAGDVPVDVINQIEKGTQAQMGGVGSTVNQAGSIAGEIAPFVMSPVKAGAPTFIEGMVSKAAPYVDKVIGAIPSFAQTGTRAVLGSGAQGAVSALATPEQTGLTPEQFAAAKGQNLGIQTAIGAVAPGIGKATDLLAAGLRKTVGMSTGAGEDALKEAFKAGKTGQPAFMENLKGNVSATEVLDQAKQALGNIRANASNEYKAGIKATKENQVFLDFKPIEKSFKEVVESLKSKGMGEEASKVGPDTLNKVAEIQKVLNEWKSKKTLHTAGGLDDLKVRLDDIYSDSMTDQAKRVLSETRNTVKNTIVAQSPTYEKTMKKYEEAVKLQREIEKALSLGKQASADTAIRKLQSLTRNNANTSYSYRKELADELRTKGGADLMPALSGQSLSSWTPRGLVGQGADVGALASILYGIGSGNEDFASTAAGAIPLAALTSPKLMGLTANTAGKFSNKALNPEQMKALKILLMKSAAQAAQGE